jgi:hypothetical protein
MAGEQEDLRGPAERLALLLQGVEILDVVLGPAGFVFHETAHGNSSGGSFASGQLVREHQALSLSFRFSLGEVGYRWGATQLSHAQYLRALNVKGAYPGFSKDPLDGFRHLLVDLNGPLVGFVIGDKTDFDLAAEDVGQSRRQLP